MNLIRDLSKSPEWIQWMWSLFSIYGIISFAKDLRKALGLDKGDNDNDRS